MKNISTGILHSSAFSLLATLWLHEPDAQTIARAVNELGLPVAEPAELALAYADVFLLNVPPYGTAFTDDYGELNGERTQEVARLFESHDYAPSELTEVAAPDHLGLCLGCLATGHEAIWAYMAEWAPVCCLAVEYEPTAHAFYRALAAKTRAAVFAHCPIGNTQSAQFSNLQLPLTHDSPDEELRLKDLLRFFLTPARCGAFLSRARLGQMARALGMRLPFGSRFEVAEALFIAAGDNGETLGLLAMLEDEVSAWAEAYRAWAEESPGWQPAAEVWLSRAGAALKTLSELRVIAEANPA
jgi:TorA maturation chaperone TorD